MRKSKRVLFKPKVFGFNPYADQVPAIKQIMEESGQESEAPILRLLIDEALWARRRKAAGIQSPQQSAPAKDQEKSLQTIQELLLKLIRQGEIALRIESVNLELLQETLAEARAGRIESLGHSGAPCTQGTRQRPGRNRELVRGADKGRSGFRLWASRGAQGSVRGRRCGGEKSSS